MSYRLTSAPEYTTFFTYLRSHPGIIMGLYIIIIIIIIITTSYWARNNCKYTNRCT
jgi:hypothetical protein